jgi:hypothetical protein
MQLENITYSVYFWNANHSGAATFTETVNMEGDYLSDLKQASEKELAKYDLLGSIICNAFRDEKHGYAELDLKAVKHD